MIERSAASEVMVYKLGYAKTAVELALMYAAGLRKGTSFEQKQLGESLVDTLKRTLETLECPDLFVGLSINEAFNLA